MITAKLVPPECGKNWSLQFFGVPYPENNKNGCVSLQPERSNIWCLCKYFGAIHKTNPFLKGDACDWIIIEFWTSNEDEILKTCEKVCKKLDIELQF